MRWLGLAILLLLSGCYPYGYPYYGYPYSGYGYGYGYGGYPSYQTYSPGYYSPAPAPYVGQQSYSQGAQTGFGQPAATDPHNCGTPDEPKPCYR